MTERLLAAAPNITPIGTPAINVNPETAINKLFNTVFDNLALIAGGIAVIYITWYGIQYITSGGSPEKAKAARQAVINAVIGIVIVVSAYIIIRLAIAIGKEINGLIS